MQRGRSAFSSLTLRPLLDQLVVCLASAASNKSRPPKSNRSITREHSSNRGLLRTTPRVVILTRLSNNYEGSMNNHRDHIMYSMHTTGRSWQNTWYSIIDMHAWFWTELSLGLLLADIICCDCEEVCYIFLLREIIKSNTLHFSFLLSERSICSYMSFPTNISQPQVVLFSQMILKFQPHSLCDSMSLSFSHLYIYIIVRSSADHHTTCFSLIM
jgi:hypothetical protein